MTEPVVTAKSSPILSVAQDDRVRLRQGAAVLLLGGLIFLLGVSRPVVRVWAEAWEDEAARIAIAKADSSEFRFGFVTMGIGYAVMGIGAGLVLWGMVRVFAGRRSTIAAAAAAIAVLGGLTVGLERAILTLVDIEQAAADGGIAGIVGTTGLSFGFAACGFLSWRGPFPRSAGLPFAIAGLIAAPTIPAVFMFAAIGFGLFAVLYLRQSRALTLT